MEMMLNDPFIRLQFIKRVRGRRVEWNKDGCKKWLKVIRALMAVAIHIAYGQLARAEELATVRSDKWDARVILVTREVEDYDRI